MDILYIVMPAYNEEDNILEITCERTRSLKARIRLQDSLSLTAEASTERTSCSRISSSNIRSSRYSPTQANSTVPR